MLSALRGHRGDDPLTVERALTAYKKEGLNCAQSILRAFQSHRRIPEEAIINAERLGGGQAEAGVCGALYAALQLMNEPPARQRLSDAFVARAGSDKCGEIGISCVECVRLAASLTMAQGGGATKGVVAKN